MKTTSAALLFTIITSSVSGQITKESIDERIQSFGDAVPAISAAFWDNGGTPADEEQNKKACDAAYETAMGALNLAYGYDLENGIVLFKPTYTTGEYTFRPTIQGALSYFIGTDCVLLAGTESDFFPPGNTDGSMFREFGFALNNYRGGKGWKAPTVWDAEDFNYLVNVDAAAQGQMCFTSMDSETDGNACVDKTFTFGTRDDGTVVITGHHSSPAVGLCTGSIVAWEFDPESECFDNTDNGDMPADEGNSDNNNGGGGGDGGGGEGSPGTRRRLASNLAAAVPAFFLGMLQG